MIKKCISCGAVLNFTDEGKIGYTPKKDAKICERCFKLKNYNKKVDVELKYSNDEIITLINKKAEQIIFVTDYLSLSKKVVSIFNKLNKPKYLVINKCDYIPNSINKEKYISWVKDSYKVDNVILLSTLSGYRINELNNIIKECKNTYICGFTNSGKSSIINALCKINGKTSNILSSLMPNTTLDVIKVSIDTAVYLFDTPGFIGTTDFNESLYPKKYLKPITIQTKANDIININDMLYIKTDSIENSFTFYISDKLSVKKYYKDNIDFINEYKISDNSELFIEGLGFINIKKNCTILLSKYSANIETRNSSF